MEPENPYLTDTYLAMDDAAFVILAEVIRVLIAEGLADEEAVKRRLQRLADLLQHATGEVARGTVLGVARMIEEKGNPFRT
ncbi:hypothetical protein SAMN05216548_10725 [Faunimonas pinastri]|uniref:Uncharacterized protein n=1 Tax=Faunimonas pinastri TaxID=1855383 RepID=A0A1H9I9B4_9HYPH|nr:hypothetical protein [Faunimonas pinastri]SEQ71136.1 hypothetical protein SAMN05216548_10725 [Faunimonas pinastri]